MTDEAPPSNPIIEEAERHARNYEYAAQVAGMCRICGGSALHCTKRECLEDWFQRDAAPPDGEPR